MAVCMDGFTFTCGTRQVNPEVISFMVQSVQAISLTSAQKDDLYSM
jgi:hypothetical protein